MTTEPIWIDFFVDPTLPSLREEQTLYLVERGGKECRILILSHRLAMIWRLRWDRKPTIELTVQGLDRALASPLDELRANGFQPKKFFKRGTKCIIVFDSPDTQKILNDSEKDKSSVNRFILHFSQAKSKAEAEAIILKASRIIESLEGGMA